MAVVGVCTSGKTTVAAGLRERGYDAYSVAQEHSSIRRFWAMRKPDFLLYLYCSLETARARRAVYWGQEMLDRQLARLADARGHCDLYVDTSDNSPEMTVQIVEAALRERFGGAVIAAGHAGDA